MRKVIACTFCLISIAIATTKGSSAFEDVYYASSPIRVSNPLGEDAAYHIVDEDVATVYWGNGTYIWSGSMKTLSPPNDLNVYDGMKVIFYWSAKKSNQCSLIRYTTAPEMSEPEVVDVGSVSCTALSRR